MFSWLHISTHEHAQHGDNRSSGIKSRDGMQWASRVFSLTLACGVFQILKFLLSLFLSLLCSFKTVLCFSYLWCPLGKVFMIFVKFSASKSSGLS